MVSLVVITAIAASACGASEGSSAAPQRETTRQADLTRTTLLDAVEAGRAYGQARLGHLRDMKLRDLEREGLVLADNMSLDIRADHTGFCIQMINEELPSIHPWAKGTVSSRSGTPSSADRCQL